MSAIIFDVDDTLYDQVDAFKRAYDKVFKKRFELPMEDLYKASRKYSDEVFEVTQRGEMSMDDMYVYRLSKAFLEFDIWISREEALRMQEEYANNQKNLHLEENMKHILEYCVKHRIKIGVITNGPSKHQWNKIYALDLELYIQKKWIFVSGDIGVAKPNREIFDYAKEKMELLGETIYFVGDSFENDIIGAKKAGWKAIWLNRRGYRRKEGEEKADYEVKSTEELLQLIQRFPIAQ